jgi:hypothetical protein
LVECVLHNIEKLSSLNKQSKKYIKSILKIL